jgi:hypothetical protein
LQWLSGKLLGYFAKSAPVRSRFKNDMHIQCIGNRLVDAIQQLGINDYGFNGLGLSVKIASVKSIKQR